MDWNLLQFIIFPYVSLAICITLSIYRFNYRPFTISSLSSQLLERKMLYWGSVSFHYGILIVLLGHLLAIGLPFVLVMWNANLLRLYLLEITALALALWALCGLLTLLFRRLSVARLKTVTTPMDWVVLLLLGLQAITGILIATRYRFGSAWFPNVITPYLWSVLLLKPKIDLIVPLPWIIKFHITNFFILLTIFPFSRLVHIVTFPIGYFSRSWQIVTWNRRKQRQISLIQSRRNG